MLYAPAGGVRGVRLEGGGAGRGGLSIAGVGDRF